MKSILGACLFLAATASQALATITVVTPWADLNWNAGGHGNITWKAEGADAKLKCDIQLMNGDVKNANMVARVTSSENPVDCSVGKYDIYPLNDFASGKYSIRIGQSSSNTWAYSGLFNFKGTGSAKPLQLANGAATSASATATKTGAANQAVTSATMQGNATGSASGSTPTNSNKNAAGKLPVGSVMMTLVPAVAAAIAFTS